MFRLNPSHTFRRTNLFKILIFRTCLKKKKKQVHVGTAANTVTQKNCCKSLQNFPCVVQYCCTWSKAGRPK